MEESEEEEEEDVEGEDGMKEDCLSDEPHNGECKRIVSDPPLLVNN